MNWSKYNYLFKSSQYGYLLYNSLSNSFAELDEESYFYLQTLEGKKKDINIIDDELHQSLLKMKALVEDDRDEFYNIKYLTHLQRFTGNYLELTLNPTLHCNFACPYCFENTKRSVYMTDEVENALIDFVKKLNHVKSLHVTWFGGEPLMAFDRIVSLTKQLKQQNIGYSSSMITNGYLLTGTVVERLDDLSISSIQITIDGLADAHNKRRPLVSGGGTFEKIIENIDRLNIKKPDCSIIIRMNIDDTNAQNFVDVFKFFTKRYKNKIGVAPGFVTNETGCTVSDCVFNREKKAKFILDQYRQHGLNVMGLYPSSVRYECPIRNPSYMTIGPEGEIYI